MTPALGSQGYFSSPKKKMHRKTESEMPKNVVLGVEKKKSNTEVGGNSGVIPGGAVIYVGRIPHGFYEDEMRAYFSQFGDITRLRISRNRVTGASKHFAFIEFRHVSVAKVAAETMHNYLLFGHLLQCKVVPNEEVHPHTFKGANKKFRPVPWKEIAQKQQSLPRTETQIKRAGERKTKKEAKLKSKLQELGIDL